MATARNIKKGDWITFKAATRWNCGTVRRKVVNIGMMGEIEVRYGGWSNFVVRPREIKKVEKAADVAFWKAPQQPPKPPAPAFQFKLLEFNPRRQTRGADAARVECIEPDGHSYWLWMSPGDLRKNIKAHGSHPELVKALDAYAGKAA